MQERLSTYSEQAQRPLRSADEIRQFIDELEFAGQLAYAAVGIVTGLKLGEGEVLLLQELEHNVFMRLLYLVEVGDQHVPQVELWFYIDGHLTYYPLVLRGSALGRMTHVKEQRQIAAFADYWGAALRRQEWLEESQPMDLARLEDILTEQFRLTDPERQRLVGHGCEAVDGCPVPLDGRCHHGHLSWLRELDLL